VFLDADFTPDGKTLLLAGADHSVVLVDMATAKKSHRLHAHSDAVTAVAVSADGRFFASAGLDRIAKVFETPTAKLKTTYRDHQNALYSVGFLPNMEMISAGKDKSAHVWGQSEPKKKRELAGQGDLLRTLVSGTSVFAGGSAKKIIETTVDKISVTRSFEGLSDWIYSIAYHRATHRLAAGCYDGSVAVWDTETGQLNAKFPGIP
jgi:WD40 repeat protein